MQRANGSNEDDALEAAVAALVARATGAPPTRVQRLRAFATNAVWEVDAPEHRLVVKASALHEALRAEAWAAARAAEAGLATPAVLLHVPLGDGFSALVMTRLDGRPIAPGAPALSELGAALRRLHATPLAGFGWLAQGAWDERGALVLRHASWLAFLRTLCEEASCLSDHHAHAGAAVASATSTIAAFEGELASVGLGSLCHGDLKTAHVFADDRGDLAGVIDWGDALAGDPLFDVARFAHRADAASLAALLAGYDPERALADELAWRVPLYAALWTLLDATVDHRLGQPVNARFDAVTADLDAALASR